MLELYTDGSAAKNRSGWGFVAVYDDGFRAAGKPIRPVTD